MDECDHAFCDDKEKYEVKFEVVKYVPRGEKPMMGRYCQHHRDAIEDSNTMEIIAERTVNPL